MKFEDLGFCACGQRIGADTKEFAVIHALPLCEKFKQLKADEFLSYVRKHREAVRMAEKN